ncbi:MAG TPA: hypothetical protein VNY84_03355, partial [Acidimicrobiales bacterium]|nr:hypothetical protein [Acidimicrobiales bacterium]
MRRTAWLLALAAAATACHAGPAAKPAKATAAATTAVATTLPATTVPPIIRAQPVTASATPATAASLLPELVRIEMAIRDPAATEAAIVALGADEQRHIGVLSSHPDWLADLPATTPPPI